MTNLGTLHHVEFSTTRIFFSARGADCRVESLVGYILCHCQVIIFGSSFLQTMGGDGGDGVITDFKTFFKYHYSLYWPIFP